MSMMNEEYINRVRKKSIKPGIHIVFGNKKRIVVRFKTFLLANAVALGIFSGGIAAAANTIDNVKNDMEFRTYIEQYDNAMRSDGAVYRTGDQMQYFAYNDDIIAAEVAMSSNPEFEMYNVYKNISNANIEGYLKEENLDDIVRSISIVAKNNPDNEKIQCFNGCSSWNDFLNKQQFVYDGEPSVEMFETYVKMAVDAELKQQEVVNKFGGTL